MNDHINDAWLYMVPPTRDDIEKELVKALSAGYGDAAEKIVSTAGGVLTVEILDAAMQSIKFDAFDLSVLDEPTFEFRSDETGRCIAEDQLKRHCSYFKKENGHWYREKRIKNEGLTKHIKADRVIERWLNNQLAQHVLKLTMEN